MIMYEFNPVSTKIINLHLNDSTVTLRSGMVFKYLGTYLHISFKKSTKIT